MKKIICGIAVVILLIFAIRVVIINKQYPATKEISCNLNEIISYKDIEYKVTDFKFVNSEDARLLINDKIDDDYIKYNENNILITLEITNDSDEDYIFKLKDYIIENDVYGSAFDLEYYLGLNYDLEYKCDVIIAKGQTETLQMMLGIDEQLLTKSQYKNLENEKWRFVLSFYPEKYEIKLN